MHQPDPAFAAIPVAVTLAPEHRHRAAIERHLRGRAHVRHVDGVSALLREASTLEVGALIYHAARPDPAGDLVALRSARSRFPHLPLLAIAHRDAARTRASQSEGELGTATIVPDGDPDLLRLVDRLLDRAVAASAAGRLLALTDIARPALDPVARRFIALSATAPRAVSSIAAVTERLALSRRTLEKHLRSAAMPEAHVLFWTIMIVRAAVLLQDPRATLQRVAALLPFPDPAAVSARFRRYGGRPTGAVRTANGLGDLIGDFARLLSGHPVVPPLRGDDSSR